jgi:capsular polysaccharide biosynthesis protein
VDIDEAVWRFRANLGVIVFGLIVGLVAAATIGLSRDPTYRASARLVIDAKDPRSVSDARAIADMGRAIVGSEGRIAVALNAAGAGRDPTVYAQNNVRIQPVGSSAVLELSVVDTDPIVAAAVTNLLADALIQTRKQIAEARFADVLKDLDARIAGAKTTVRYRLRQLSRAAGQRGVSPVTERYREAVRSLQDLESDRRRVFEEKAAVPEPSVLEPAAVPTKAESTGVVPDVALGAVLGLVLGLGLAAIRETLRPTVAGDRAIARVLGVPSVGTLSRPPRLADDGSLKAVGMRLRLAAEAAGVRKLALTSAARHIDLDAFARRLSAVMDADENGHRPAHDRRISWEVFSTEGDRLKALRESPATVGLVLVAPNVFKRRDIDGIMDLRLITGWQLFGCVTYPRPRWPRRGRAVAPRNAPQITPVGRREEAKEVSHPSEEAEQPQRIILDEPASTSVVLDKTPSTAGMGITPTLQPETLPPSAATGPAPGAGTFRASDPVASSGDEPAVGERAAGPEGSLHWAPWGWQ